MFAVAKATKRAQRLFSRRGGYRKTGTRRFCITFMPVIRVFANFIHKLKILSLQNVEYMLKLYGRVNFTIKSYFAGRVITKKLFPM